VGERRAGRTLVNTLTDNGTDALQVNGSISGTSAAFSGAGSFGSTLRIGGALKSWDAFEPALQIKTMALGSSGQSNGRIFTNTYYDGNYRYQGTGTATMYEADGGFFWSTAASGVANGLISWVERMRLTTAGNVLIKTTTDNGTDALQVAGSGLFTQSGAATALKTSVGGGGYQLLMTNTASSNYQYGWYMDGNDLILRNVSAVLNPLTISSTGAATFSSSIAATSAAFSGAGSFGGALTLNAANNQVRSGNEIRYYRADNAVYTQIYDGGSGSGLILDNRNGDGFSFQSAGTTYFKISNNNNTLIKTTTDNGTDALQVSGTALINGRFRIGGFYIADISGTGNNTGISFGGSALFPSDGTGTYSSKNLGESTSRWGTYFGSSGDFSSSVTANSFVKSGGTSAQFLKGDGSVDTNTYATTNALSGYLPLSGGTLTGALNGTSAAFSGAGSFLGNVGIGTASPSARLDVVSDDGANGINIRTRNFSNDYAFINFKSNSGSEILSEIFIQRTAANTAYLGFTTNNGSGAATERMRITSGGNLLIRTTTESPNNEALQVAGSVRATLGASFATSGGDVGIGTATPTARLQINRSSAGAAAVGLFLLNESVTTNTEIRLAFAANENNDIASDRYSYISALNTSGSNGQALIFATNETGSAAVERLRIAATGAITASSSVTASSLIKSGGTSTQALIADGSVLGISNSAGANTLVQRDASGYIFNSYFNTSSGGAERNASGMGYFAGFNSSDYYIRSYTPTAARIAMGLATTDNVTFNQVTATLIGISSGVVINYNNDSASTYQMLWGSGNYVYGTAGIYCNPSTDTIYANGNIIAYASSDSRYKDNQQLITNPIGKLLALRGMTFTWNNLQQDFKGNDYGLIYQDVAAVMPEITQMRANGYGAIKYEKVIPLLVEVGKNHEQRIQELEDKLQAYENKFGKLN
jgi:hypothetical protein